MGSSDRVSTAAATPVTLAGTGIHTSHTNHTAVVASVSPRHSVASGDWCNDYRPSFHHVPGKRRAPGPPAVTESLGDIGPSTFSATNDASSSSSSFPASNQQQQNISKKKAPAPQPPHATSPPPTSSAATSTPSQSSSTGSESSYQQQHSSALQQGLTSAQETRTNDSWMLEAGQLRPLCTNTDLLTPINLQPNQIEKEEKLQEEENSMEVKEAKAVPLSPKPWYKRSIRDAADKKDKKSKEKREKKDKKAKSPVNLPEVHAGREGIKIQENFEEKYSYFSECRGRISTRF